MKTLLMIVSFCGLVLTILPAFLVFAGKIDFNYHIILMIVGTILWFLSAPFWLNKREEL